MKTSKKCIVWSSQQYDRASDMHGDRGARAACPYTLYRLVMCNIKMLLYNELRGKKPQIGHTF